MSTGHRTPRQHAEQGLGSTVRALSARAPADPSAAAALPPDGLQAAVERMRQAEADLSGQHELLRVTLEAVGEGVVSTDLQGRVRWFNPVAERMSGWAAGEASGRLLDEILHIVDSTTQEPVDGVVMACLKGSAGRREGHHTLWSRNGRDNYAIEFSTTPIPDPEGRTLGAVVVFRDVSEQRKAAMDIERRAHFDVLTGLLNRAEFERRLGRLIRSPASSAEHSLMYIDLDQFKLVNDACGHAAGDKVLREVAVLLQSAVRAGDSVARIGGDEFAIILENCTLAQADLIGEQICRRMEDRSFIAGNRPFRLGTSIGLVKIDGRWSDVKALLQAGDTACYGAKEAGRNRVQAWHNGDRVQLRRTGEMRWAARLAEALDNNHLELFAQRIEPTHGPEDGLHCELLLRLREPDGRMVSPAAFVVAAERFHMATLIDRWVIRRAIKLLQWAQSMDVPITLISINVSGQSISDPTFRLDLAEALTESGLDLGQLCFELTETVLASNFADAEAFVREIHRLGARIAVDDFGVGAASLGMLKDLPEGHIDYLKIDGVFIRDNFANPLDGVAVRFFQELARTIGAETVAEWVQDAAVRRQLGELGVDFVQGYLIHRPQSFTELIERYAPAAATHQAS